MIDPKVQHILTVLNKCSPFFILLSLCFMLGEEVRHYGKVGKRPPSGFGELFIE